MGLVYRAEIVDVHQQLAQCRDLNDRKFLDLACSGNATDIVSGDSDLLELHPFQGIAVLIPADFVKKWRHGTSEF